MTPDQEKLIDKAVNVMKDNRNFKKIRINIHPNGYVMIERYQVTKTPK